MSNKLKILAVDDEPWNLEILEHYLEDNYDLVMAKDGQEALDALGSVSDIKMVLLDVSMPGMDGYEVCQKIREHDKYSQVPVIFISARGSVEERMQGYKSGGDDYLVKPFECDELLSKIKLLERYDNERQGLKDNYQMASNVAMDAMTGSQEIGMALEYSKNTYGIKNESDLMKLLVNCLMGFGLNAIIRLKSGSEFEWHQCVGDPSPLETELVEMLATKDRIFSFEHRTQFNFDRINLLVKNMPIDDDNKYGRYKDLLPFFLDATNACMESIEDSKTIADHNQLKSAISTVNRYIDEEKKLIKESQDILGSILRDLNRTVEDELPILGLEEDQEKFLVGLIETKITEASAAANISKHSDQLFEQISNTLTALMKK